jgi:catechol 2,3-dioxygenase-like lactoylglutathione lyase family enzyme
MGKNLPLSRREFLISLPGLAMAGSTFAQGTAAPIRVRGINHATLAVSDLKRSLDFYQGLFGMPVINRQGNTSVALQIGNGPQHIGISAAGSTAPRIDHLCLAVDNFDVDRLKKVLGQHGITESQAAEPMRMRVRVRGPEDGGGNDGTPEFYFRDPDGISMQLQDPTYCGGSGRLGNVCPAPEPSPKKGMIALKNWSHATNFVSDPARSNKFYQDVFGFKVQAYQGPNAPLMGIGAGVQFLMFGGGGGGRAAGINHVCASMDNFDPEKVIKILEGYGIKPRGNTQGTPRPLVHYINLRMENRGGAKEGTPELYFTDPDGIPIQIQDTRYCGGAGVLGEVCLK